MATASSSTPKKNAFGGTSSNFSSASGNVTTGKPAPSTTTKKTPFGATVSTQFSSESKGPTTTIQPQQKKRSGGGGSSGQVTVDTSGGITSISGGTIAQQQATAQNLINQRAQLQRNQRQAFDTQAQAFVGSARQTTRGTTGQYSTVQTALDPITGRATTSSGLSLQQNVSAIRNRLAGQQDDVVDVASGRVFTSPGLRREIDSLSVQGFATSLDLKLKPKQSTSTPDFGPSFRAIASDQSGGVKVQSLSLSTKPVFTLQKGLGEQYVAVDDPFGLSRQREAVATERTGDTILVDAVGGTSIRVEPKTTFGQPVQQSSSPQEDTLRRMIQGQQQREAQGVAFSEGVGKGFADMLATARVANERSQSSFSENLGRTGSAFLSQVGLTPSTRAKATAFGDATATALVKGTAATGATLVGTSEKIVVTQFALNSPNTKTREAVLRELTRAGVETPGVVARSLDPRTPEGLAGLTGVGLGVGALSGARLAAIRTPSGALTRVRGETVEFPRTIETFGDPQGVPRGIASSGPSATIIKGLRESAGGGAKFRETIITDSSGGYTRTALRGKVKVVEVGEVISPTKLRVSTQTFSGKSPVTNLKTRTVTRDAPDITALVNVRAPKISIIGTTSKGVGKQQSVVERFGIAGVGDRTLVSARQTTASDLTQIAGTKKATVSGGRVAITKSFDFTSNARPSRSLVEPSSLLSTRRLRPDVKIVKALDEYPSGSLRSANVFDTNQRVITSGVRGDVTSSLPLFRGLTRDPGVLSLLRERSKTTFTLKQTGKMPKGITRAQVFEGAYETPRLNRPFRLARVTGKKAQQRLSPVEESLVIDAQPQTVIGKSTRFSDAVEVPRLRGQRSSIARVELPSRLLRANKQTRVSTGLNRSVASILGTRSSSRRSATQVQVLQNIGITQTPRVTARTTSASITQTKLVPRTITTPRTTTSATNNLRAALGPAASFGVARGLPPGAVPGMFPSFRLPQGEQRRGTKATTRETTYTNKIRDITQGFSTTRATRTVNEQGMFKGLARALRR